MATCGEVTRLRRVSQGMTNSYFGHVYCNPYSLVFQNDSVTDLLQLSNVV